MRSPREEAYKAAEQAVNKKLELTKKVIFSISKRKSKKGNLIKEERINFESKNAIWVLLDEKGKFVGVSYYTQNPPKDYLVWEDYQAYEIVKEKKCARVFSNRDKAAHFIKTVKSHKKGISSIKHSPRIYPIY